MSTSMQPLNKAVVQEVHAGLASAGDTQIARIVAMVDAMSVRGEADALIAPLRARLAQLRPARPFGFVRLLFTPLDPVILPPAHWTPGDIGLPRSALAPMGAAVQSTLSALSAELTPGLASLSPEDSAGILATGERLWPAAAAELARLPPPPDWVASSGLPPDSYAALAAAAAAALAEAAVIERHAASRTAIPDEAIRAIFSRTEPRGRGALATVMAVLLARLPATDQLLRIAAELGPRGPADDALNHTLARLQAAAPTDDVDPDEAAVDAGRIAALLAGMEANAPPERRRRLEQVRREADTLCLGRFERVASSALTQVIDALQPGGEEMGDDSAALLESAVRDLRRIETAGRRLGSADQYDARLATIAQTVTDQADAIPLADRVRLIEILSGPDAALSLLSGPV